MRIVLLLASSLGDFDSRAFVAGLFSFLSLRDDQLLELSERAGSVHLTAMVRADGAAQAAAIAEALEANNQVQQLLLGRALGVLVLVPPVVTIEIKIEDAGPPRPPPRPPSPPPPTPPVLPPPTPPSGPPSAPLGQSDEAMSLEAQRQRDMLLAVGATLGTVGLFVLVCLVCRRYGRVPECMERRLGSQVLASRKQRPMLSHGAYVVPVVQAPMPWEREARPLQIEMTPQQDAEGASRAAASDGDGGYTPPTAHTANPNQGGDGGGEAGLALEEAQQPRADDVVAPQEVAPEVVTTVSAMREPGSTAAEAQPGCASTSGGGKRKLGKAPSSGASLLPRALNPRRQGCMTAPVSSPPPVVYAVDEDGVGSLPPTQSFAQGERRYTDEEVEVHVTL